MYIMYSSCVIGGCVKNCEQYIDAVFENIIKIHKLFKKTKIIMSFDNSNDLSLKKLCEKKFNIEFINQTYNENENESANAIDCTMDIIINRAPPSNIRTVNIERARNKILDMIYDKDKDKDYEYFIMIDMDDVSSKPINLEVLQNALENNTEWDGLFFNNQNYYDFWALSIGDFQYSCWHSTDVKRILNAMNREIHSRFQELKNLNMDKWSSIECQSAFGGFGIYKTAKFQDCRYRSQIDLSIYSTPEMLHKFANMYNTLNIQYIMSDNINDCEHRYYHINAIRRNGARLRISPDHLFPPYIGEHTTYIDRIDE